MTKTRELSTNEKQWIVNLHQEGLSTRNIAGKTGILPSTIGYAIRRWKSRGTVVNQPRNGRPKVTNPRIDRKIIKKVLNNRRISAPKIVAEIAEECGVTISSKTVQRKIHEHGFQSRIARKKPFISKTNKMKRVSWAQIHATWPIDQWKKVLWSDESKFNLFGTDGVVKVWRKTNEEYNSKCMRATVKHGGGNVIVWGCMSWNGVGLLAIVDCKMTKEVYIRLLEENLQKSVKKLKLGRNFIFQHDNDPKHTAKIVTEYIKTKKVHVLPWPAQSPDMNPIEHLWSELERRLTYRKPSSKSDLVKMLLDEWDKITPEVTKNLVESMGRRTSALLASKGYPTKY